MASSLLKSGTMLSVLTLASRLLGLLREMTKARFLGTSALSDAFTVAFVIPNLLRRLFAENSISVAFIPTFRNFLAENNKEETRAFLSSCFTFISFAVTSVVVLGILITPWIVPFFGTAEAETVFLTRIMFPYLAVISVAAFFQGILNGVKIFLPSGFTPVLFNLCVIGFTWLFRDAAGNPARAMAFGVTAGGCLQAAFQLPFVLRTGFRFSFTPLRRAFSNPGTRTVLRLVGPTVFGMAAYQLNDLVSTILAGNAGEGVVSSLQYSLRLQELILGIFAVSIGTVILPDLSGLAKQQKWEQFNTMLIQAVRIIALITIPITFFSLITGSHIISLVYKSNNFTDESVQLTLEAFNCHIAGLLFIAVNRIISPAFYAQGNTKLPTLAGIIGFAINIICALILVTPFAGGGIALALTIASAANTIFLFIFLAKTGTVAVNRIAVDMILYAVKMILFSLVASLPVYLLQDKLFSLFAGHNRIVAEGIPLILNASIFALVGILLLVLFRDPVAAVAMGKLRKSDN